MPALPEAATGPAICVDPAEVRRLADTLDGIAATLRGSALNSADFGDRYVSAALQDVQRDWSRARQAICSFLDDASATARRAAEGYAVTEAAICRAAR